MAAPTAEDIDHRPNESGPIAEKCTRDPVTRLSPPELKALHPLGAAPLLKVDGMLLAEPGAIVDFIPARYGRGRLQHGSGHPDFASSLYHFPSGNLQPVVGRSMIVGRRGLGAEPSCSNVSAGATEQSARLD